MVVMIKKIAICSFMFLFCAKLCNAAELPDWNIDKWCEASIEELPPDKNIRLKGFMNCQAEEIAAKGRLAKMDKDQELITRLANEADELSYVMLEADVVINRGY